MENVRRNLIYNILYQLLIIILPLVTAPYISRTLGANSVGIYSYTNSIAYYFLLIAMLGISTYGNRSIASIRDEKKKISKTFFEIYSIQFITFLIAIFIYIIYSVFIVNENNDIFLIQLFYIVSGLLDISWLFFGLEKFKITVTRNTAIKLLTVICMFVFVKNPDDLWKYTLIMSLGTFISQAYLWVYLKKYVHFENIKFNNVKKHIKPILILFIPVIAYSIYKVMDKIMLGTMSTYEQVAFYQNSEKIINIPIGIITALGTVMLPRMSNIISKGEDEKTSNYIRISIKLVTLIGSAITFGIIGTSKIFAPVYLGSEFSSCSTTMTLLSITVFALSWANVVRTQYLIPSHNDRIYVFSTITGAIINIIINAILIPEFGANGAAIGTIFAEFSVMLFQVIAVSKKLPILKNIVDTIPYLITGFIMMIVVYFEGEFLGESIFTLITQIFTGGLIYILLIFIYLYIIKDEMYKLIITSLKSKLNKRKNM